MLESFDFKQEAGNYDSFKRSELGEKLDRLQRIVSNLDIPVLILVDGWESSGKGFVINDLTRELDPRFVRVEVFEEATDVEKKHPSVWRFWQKIPSHNEIAIYDRSFYYQVFNKDKRTNKMLKQRTQELLNLEKMLLDDDTIVIKFFLNISEATQEKRIKKLEKSENRSYLLSDEDYEQNKHYEEHQMWFDKVLKATDLQESPWHIINAEDRKVASKEVLAITLDKINAGIERITRERKETQAVKRDFSLEKDQLSLVNLSQSISDKDYDKQLENLQQEAAELVYKCYLNNTAIILAFEGMDAAGKGGAIKRLTRYIDPRSYKIHGIKAPNTIEKDHHYLWRFEQNFPKDGDMVIFDRSWYGRVLVERVENFATQKEWERAYDEINQMEKVQTDHGSIVMKFFLVIDKNEQKERFEDRENEIDKNYKITDEDWRNRGKWDAYYDAFNEMLQRTNTENAPWFVIAANDKKFARIQVLKHFIEHIKAHISKEDKKGARVNV
ncbi:phosphate:AMP phosphotransferase [Fundicoccus sp. Sow4_H7]|uniref:phosphate:AMP phosphotransferase n=1 Tax=Fundicoccus sp. Sow4_H7 TaxID=3438784 RepID=UPI003F8DC390